MLMKGVHPSRSPHTSVVRAGGGIQREMGESIWCIGGALPLSIGIRFITKLQNLSFVCHFSLSPCDCALLSGAHLSLLRKPGHPLVFKAQLKAIHYIVCFWLISTETCTSFNSKFMFLCL